MSEETLLTMGMPVYNEEKHIAQAIESLLAQTYKNFVIIISDNASTDNTPQICKYYAEKDKRVIYIRHNENKGAVFNFYYVVDEAKTPFFIWCSGNDKWHPFFVEKLLPAFEKKDVVLSYSEVRAINQDGTPAEVDKNDYSTTNIDNSASRYLYFLWRFRMRLSSMFYGIWRIEALKRCSLDIKVIGPDIIILYEAALEGKFKMYKEVLFWMRKADIIKDLQKWKAKQLLTITGKKSIKKKSMFLTTVSLIWAIVVIPFHNHYRMGVFTRIWLSANAFVVSMLIFFIEPTLNKISKKVLPQNYYLKLKEIWRALTKRT